MKAVKIFTACILMLLALTHADAQTTQRNRVKHGVRSGELTRHETKAIAHQKKEMRQDVKAAKADGVVTTAEKKEIRQDNKQLNKSIYRKKHNRRDRN